MGVSFIKNGRFGNNLFQYCASYIFSKKNKRKFNGDFLAPYLKRQTWETEKDDFRVTVKVDDDNFIETLENPALDANYLFDGYFQNPHFINNYKEEILDIFNFDYDQREKEGDLIVFYRLGDMEQKRESLPISYFSSILEKINFSSGFIRSDSPENPKVKILMERFGLKFLEGEDAANVVWRAKNFDKMILSEGTFSWWPAFLSQAKEIHYNWRRDRFTWHGDIFVDKNWIQHKFDWLDFTSNNFLLSQRSFSYGN